MTSDNAVEKKTYSPTIRIRDVLDLVVKYVMNDTKELAEAIEDVYNVDSSLAEELVRITVNREYITESLEFTSKGKEYYSLITKPKETYTNDKGESRLKFPGNVLTLIRGLPGSGKTETAKTIVQGLTANGRQAIHFEADAYMKENNTYRFTVSKVKECALECQAQTELYLLKGYDVVVSNVFARYWEVIPYFEMAALNSVKTQLLEAQGQWSSSTRTEDTKDSLREKWGKIELPYRWGPWISQRKKMKKNSEIAIAASAIADSHAVEETAQISEGVQQEVS